MKFLNPSSMLYHASYFKGQTLVCALNKSQCKDLGDSPINKNTNSVAALAARSTDKPRSSSSR